MCDSYTNGIEATVMSVPTPEQKITIRDLSLQNTDISASLIIRLNSLANSLFGRKDLIEEPQAEDESISSLMEETKNKLRLCCKLLDEIIDQVS